MPDLRGGPDRVSYIASHLAALGHPPAVVVTAVTELAQRRVVFEELRQGESLVGSAAVAKELDRVSPPYTVILWSHVAMLGILDRVGEDEEVRILVLVERGEASDIRRLEA